MPLLEAPCRSLPEAAHAGAFHGGPELARALPRTQVPGLELPVPMPTPSHGGLAALGQGSPWPALQAAVKEGRSSAGDRIGGGRRAGGRSEGGGAPASGVGRDSAGVGRDGKGWCTGRRSWKGHTEVGVGGEGDLGNKTKEKKKN
jgi:hypothetical protein